MTNVAVGTTHFLDIGAYDSASAQLTGNQNALLFSIGSAAAGNVFVKFCDDINATPTWIELPQFTPTDGDGMCIPNATNIRTMYELPVGHQRYMFAMATVAVDLYVTELV